MIIIGLGSGRSGTHSLAHLLNAQPHTHCFHELNPLNVAWSSTPSPILNTISEFNAILEGGSAARLTVDMTRSATIESWQQLKQADTPRVLGDVAFYYLPYVREILAGTDSVKFVCLKRDKAKTIASWEAKTTIERWPSLVLADRIKQFLTGQPYHKSYNHWMEHDQKLWAYDPIWSKCFPKFEVETKREAIEAYYDTYYEMADELAVQFPDQFEIFDLESLQTDDGKRKLLFFCGYVESEMNLVDAHLNRIRS